MKRRAFKLLLLLLAGAIINLAVAWGFSLLVIGQTADVIGFTSPTAPTMLVAHFRRTGAEAITVAGFCETSGFLDANLRTFGLLDELPAPAQEFFQPECDCDRSVRKEKFGFPLPAVWWQVSGRGQISQWTVHHAIEIDRQRDDGDWPWMVLPYAPLSPGFVINTIFYAAIVWMLFAVPGMIRRRVRAQARPVCSVRVFAAGHHE